MILRSLRRAGRIAARTAPAPLRRGLDGVRVTPRPLVAHGLTGAVLEHIPLRVADGTHLALCRVHRGDDLPRPAVLLLHGHTASADMFTLPETRNLTEALLDAGYEPWLLDWRGSCRLPYNERGPRYSYDDVALYDIPEAVAHIRSRIGADAQLFAVAHCIGALTLSLSLTAGLVPGLSGVVAQGVFLTPKLYGKSRLPMMIGPELLRGRQSYQAVDIRKAGLFSSQTLAFALAARGAECTDPTCQILHNSAWGMGASLYVHENLHPRTHDRLAELFGSAPLSTTAHLRQMDLAHTVGRWHQSDRRYAALPVDAVAAAGRIDCPVLLISGNENKLWADSNKVCHEVLTSRHPHLDVRYTEVAGYGHVDPFIGRGAAFDVFGHIVNFLDELR
ncbi:alpha/beta hydrolase [Streptomyces sp. NPDC091279]|uniref:alpha/beta hydrolase n=1 Tax=unclassified Streptomyces TaxID=2593676 RepID=UPI0037F71E2E